MGLGKFMWQSFPLKQAKKGKESAEEDIAAEGVAAATISDKTVASLLAVVIQTGERGKEGRSGKQARKGVGRRLMGGTGNKDLYFFSSWLCSCIFSALITLILISLTKYPGNFNKPHLINIQYFDSSTIWISPTTWSKVDNLVRERQDKLNLQRS